MSGIFQSFESDTLETIKKKGQALEASTLLDDLKLYLEERLEVYWGRVHIMEEEAKPSR